MTNVAVDCILEQLAKTELGTFNLDTRSLKAMVNGTDIVTGDLDSTRLANSFPVLMRKIGNNVPLAFEFSYQDMKVNFAT